MICVVVRRAGGCHLRLFLSHWCGFKGINVAVIRCLFNRPFVIIFPSPTALPQSIIFPRSCWGVGGKWHFFLFFTCCRSQHGGILYPTRPYCFDRVVNYLLLSHLMKSYVFFSSAAAHLTLPSHLLPSPPPPFHQSFVRAPLHGIALQGWLEK